MESKLCRAVALSACLIFNFQIPIFNSLHAQESAFEAHRQALAILPGSVANVSVVDGELYCHSSGVLLKAQRSGQQLLGFWADTSFSKFSEGIDYAVRHPQSGQLYFTMRDKKGRSYLYCGTRKGDKYSFKRLRLGGSRLFNKGMTVLHPTFSADGKFLIFSSADKQRSHGGYDLWYSQFDGKRWSKPANLGSRINTPGDDISPSIYRDWLLFASNGHKDDLGRLNLYATRLVSDRVQGDTVGMLQIGRSRVQRLPEPLNVASANDFDMAIDTASGFGYWVSSRNASASDSQLFSFAGALDGVQLWGLVSDAFDRTLSGVHVTARQGERVVCNTFTDQDGFFRMYLQCDQYYDLSFQLDGYFVAFETVNTAKSDDELLIAEARRDVRLERLPMGERIYYEDLFGPNVDVELSNAGMERLAPLVRFLNDNPATSVQMSLTNDLTDDRTFNRLLTEQRIQSLQAYLYPLLPPTVKITIVNGCAGTTGCTNASGVSRLMVVVEE